MYQVLAAGLSPAGIMTGLAKPVGNGKATAGEAMDFARSYLMSHPNYATVVIVEIIGSLKATTVRSVEPVTFPAIPQDQVGGALGGVTLPVDFGTDDDGAAENDT